MDREDTRDDVDGALSDSHDAVAAQRPLVVSNKLDPDMHLDDELAESCGKVEENDLPKPLLECPVCLQPCIHPVQLPCSHVFCFLCVKGVANRSKRCALCRQEIPLSFFHNPKLVNQEELQRNAAFEDGYQWFYEGRNGWWQYDERTSAELEDKYKQGEKSFELLIAGFLYVIDLDSMLQYRRNDPTRRRRIKRDLENIPEKKGVAGLRVAQAVKSTRQGAYGVENSDSSGKIQPPSSGDGPPDQGVSRGHVTSSGLSPLLPPAPSNPQHSSQSPATQGQSDLNLPSMMDNLHISHAGDGHSTSPDLNSGRMSRQPTNRQNAPQSDSQTVSQPCRQHSRSLPSDRPTTSIREVTEGESGSRRSDSLTNTSHRSGRDGQSASSMRTPPTRPSVTGSSVSTSVIGQLDSQSRETTERRSRHGQQSR